MSPIEPKFSRTYYRSHGCLGAMFLGFALMIGLTVGNRRGPWGWIATFMGPVAWAAVVGREFVRGPKRLDDEGITRRDGRRFLWSDLQKKQDVHRVMPWGGPGPLNHIDLIFSKGKVRILPLVLDPSTEILRFIARFEPGAKPPQPQPQLQPQPTPTPRPASKETAPLPPVIVAPAVAVPLPSACRICSQLSDLESGTQTVGREDEDTFLPDIAAELKTVRELEPGNSRTGTLKRCPECGTHYLYRSIYEYLVYGSEDTQELTRLSAAEAERLLQNS